MKKIEFNEDTLTMIKNIFFEYYFIINLVVYPFWLFSIIYHRDLFVLFTVFEWSDFIALLVTAQNLIISFTFMMVGLEKLGKMLDHDINFLIFMMNFTFIFVIIWALIKISIYELNDFLFYIFEFIFWPINQFRYNSFLEGTLIYILFFMILFSTLKIINGNYTIDSIKKYNSETYK